MRISNGVLCNTYRAHAAQIKLIHIDLNKGEQSYIGILLAGVKTSGRGRIMQKCSLYCEIKVFLNKKLISMGAYARFAPQRPPMPA